MRAFVRVCTHIYVSVCAKCIPIETNAEAKVRKSVLDLVTCLRESEVSTLARDTCV
jgi:hypothetical protein